jgi:hypothetical protein
MSTLAMHRITRQSNLKEEFMTSTKVTIGDGEKARF